MIQWTEACQSPLSTGILQSRILEQVAIPFFRGLSRPRDQTQVSCIAAVLYHLSPQGSPTRGEAVTKPPEQGLIRGRRQTTYDPAHTLISPATPPFSNCRGKNVRLFTALISITHHCQTICVCLVAQWCPTLCNPMDCSPPGSSVHGILQAGILEWAAILRH